MCEIVLKLDSPVGIPIWPQSVEFARSRALWRNALTELDLTQSRAYEAFCGGIALGRTGATPPRPHPSSQLNPSSLCILRSKGDRVIILGIDPGSVVTGYGVVACEGRDRRLVDCGFLRPDPHLAFPQRLLRIYDDLLRLVADASPDEVAIEAVFFGANVKTLMKMCHARGGIMVALANSDLPIFEYAPREVKKAVVGRGNASKEQVQFMVRQLFGMEERPEPYDVTDALAVALCHANRGHLLPGSGKPGESGLAAKLAAAGAYEPRRNRLEETLKSMGVTPKSRGRSNPRGRGGQ